ncbi:MAG: DUF4147 domain-containing protein [Candidatus Magasanikbacteria bacterium]|nr:DUF4147 domain-containing protein [Candidatus Magasanikbacteria bacterium]
MINNFKELVNLSADSKEKIARRDLLEILESALAAADPFFLIKNSLKKMDFSFYRRIFVIGAGKGTFRLAEAAEEILGRRLRGGLIAVPKILGQKRLKKIKVIIAGHPLPNAGSVDAGQKTVSLLKKISQGDLVLGLFSGGASALLCLPLPGIDLKDKARLNLELLRSGAPIEEINAVRKHLSQIKGGRLAELLPPRACLKAFYLSDVVGGDISTIASGPTAPDKSTFAEAIDILKKYNLWQKTPLAIKKHLEKGKNGLAPETPKKAFPQVENFIIGNHETLARAALLKAKQIGYAAKILSAKMKGATEKVGESLIKKLHRRSAKLKTKKFILIAAGETTFKVTTGNPGGRNQQMGLAALPWLKKGDFFLAFDSDGVDGVGKEKVGGVLLDASLKRKTKLLKLNPQKFLKENDSYRFFKKIGGQIKTGFVGTNLGDIVILMRRC